LDSESYAGSTSKQIVCLKPVVTVDELDSLVSLRSVSILITILYHPHTTTLGKNISSLYKHAVR